MDNRAMGLTVGEASSRHTPAERLARPALHRYVLGETLIGAGVNVFMSVAMTWLVYHNQARVPTHGTVGLINDAIPQSFMVTLMSVLPVSLLTRARARKGKSLPLSRAGSWSAPRSLLLWAVSLSLVAAGAGYLVFLLVAAPLAPDGLSLVHALIVKAAYGAALSSIIIPIATIAALRANA